MEKLFVMTVELNGTDTNPYHQYGLRQNPFPQFAVAPYDRACLRLQSLGGDPIPDTAYIRKVLQGFSEEFIKGICDRFVPGQYVKFDISFPWDR